MSQLQEGIGANALRKIMGAGSKAIPVLGQADLGRKVLGRFSKEIIGYDFFGLLSKILFFYTFAFLIIKYFEAVILGSGVVSVFGKLAGMNLNPAFPQSVNDFFKNGLVLKKGDLTQDINPVILKPWDVVNILMFFLLLAEAINYFESNKKLGGRFSWITIGVWGLLIGGFALIAIVPILQKFKNTQNVIIPPSSLPSWLPAGYSYAKGSDGNYYAMITRADNTIAWQLVTQSLGLTGPLLVSVP